MIQTMDAEVKDTQAVNPVVICQSDLPVLRRLAAMQTNSGAERSLHTEIARAIVVHDAAFPTNTVRLNSMVEIVNLETGKPRRFRIVTPSLSNIQRGKISVLTPMGTALLGFREGDTVQWRMPGSMVRLKITRVVN